MKLGKMRAEEEVCSLIIYGPNIGLGPNQTFDRSCSLLPIVLIGLGILPDLDPQRPSLKAGRHVLKLWGGGFRVALG